MNDIASMRAMIARQKQDYEKQVVSEAGAAKADYGSAGPPTWSREAWDAFRAQYGTWPYSASELPPTFAGCPDWAYQRMGLRKPPMEVNPS
jgi:hypothetical protein